MSYGHKLRPIGASTDSPIAMNFEITWYIDVKHPCSRLRFSKRFSRITDYKGALRFCRKHGLPAPDSPTEWIKIRNSLRSAAWHDEEEMR